MITAVMATIIGGVMVSAALVDVFQTLFHPAGGGSVSDRTAHAVWKLFRKAAEHTRGILTFAGPVAFLAIISLWIILTVLGFGLIYWPHMPTSFDVQTGLPQSIWAQLPKALTSSADSLITLSEGTNAKTTWLQAMRAFEAIVGFAILTASVSWLLSLYPVLETRRSLAHTCTLLHESERIQSVDLVNGAKGEVASWLFAIAGDLVLLRNQVAQFPISQFFYVGESKTAFAGVLPYLAELADRTVVSPSVPLRMAGTMLGGAVRDFALLLAEDFLQVDVTDTRKILILYAREHMFEPMTTDTRIAAD
jgi:hypothetical protein